MQETIGRRIARLRQAGGWTQESLAARIAVSRVAISHIELGLSVPSERTVTLLAGVFKVVPNELVAGTTYPHAKAERLPPQTAWYTETEHQIGLLENDLAWLARLPEDPEWSRLADRLARDWLSRLNQLSSRFEEQESTRLEQARAKLRALLRHAAPRPGSSIKRRC